MATVSASVSNTRDGVDINISPLSGNDKASASVFRDSDHFKSALSGDEKKSSGGPNKQGSNDGTFRADVDGDKDERTLTTSGELKGDEKLNVKTQDGKFSFDNKTLPEGTVSLTKGANPDAATNPQGASESPAPKDKPMGDNKGASESPASKDKPMGDNHNPQGGDDSTSSGRVNHARVEFNATVSSTPEGRTLTTSGDPGEKGKLDVVADDDSFSFNRNTLPKGEGEVDLDALAKESKAENTKAKNDGDKAQNDKPEHAENVKAKNNHEPTEAPKNHHESMKAKNDGDTVQNDKPEHAENVKAKNNHEPTEAPNNHHSSNAHNHEHKNAGVSGGEGHADNNGGYGDNGHNGEKAMDNHSERPERMREERVREERGERGERPERMRRERGSDKPVAPNWNNDAVNNWLGGSNNADAQNGGAKGNYW